jgi:hypothetical protein
MLMEAEMNTWRQTVLLVVAAIFCASSANSAEFSADYAAFENPPIKMTGVIETGDADKFVATATALFGKVGVANFPRQLVVDSNGGSVQEAAKIASVVETLRLSTAVRGDEFKKGNRPGVCASACFLVWLAGYDRSASGLYVPSGDKLADQAFALAQSVSGMVGLHRPYLNLAAPLLQDMTQAQSQQRQAMVTLRTYLQNRNVPPELVSKMMAQSSKNVYWLRPEEVSGLRRSPEYEELLASNCAYQNTIVTSESSKEEILAFVHENSGPIQEKLMACSRELVGRLRAKELPVAFARMSKGWRPWQ